MRKSCGAELQYERQRKLNELTDGILTNTDAKFNGTGSASGRKERNAFTSQFTTHPAFAADRPKSRRRHPVADDPAGHIVILDAKSAHYSSERNPSDGENSGECKDDKTHHEIH